MVRNILFSFTFKGHKTNNIIYKMSGLTRETNRIPSIDDIISVIDSGFDEVKVMEIDFLRNFDKIAAAENRDFHLSTLMLIDDTERYRALNRGCYSKITSNKIDNNVKYYILHFEHTARLDSLVEKYKNILIKYKQRVLSQVHGSQTMRTMTI